MKKDTLRIIVLIVMIYSPVYTQIINDDFSTLNTSLYTLYHDASYDANSQLIRLTSLAGNQAGRFYLDQPELIDAFDIEFDFFMGGGSGADGMVFSFTANRDYPRLSGQYLDFSGAQGYGIVLNTFSNSGDPSEECIGLVKDNSNNYLSYWIAPNGSLEGGFWRRIRVLNEFGHIRIWLDDTLRINYTIQNYQPFQGYIGWTAASGGATNHHLIDNILIDYLTTPQVKILSPTDSSIVQIGDSLNIYVATYNPLGTDSVVFDLLWGDSTEHFIDSVAPYTLPWQVPSTLSAQSEIEILVESYTIDYRESSTSVSIFVAGIQPPVLSVLLDSIGANLGSQVSVELSVKNDGSRSGQFEYGISGLPVSWLSREFGSVYLQAGEIFVDSFIVTIPSTFEALADTGIYTIHYYGVSDGVDSSFAQSIFYVSPFISISNRRPLNGDGVIGGLTRLTFETSGPAVCSVFVNQVSEDSSSVQTFVTTNGYGHEIVLDSLIRDSSYIWSISAVADWGWVTNGYDYQFTVVNGVVFADDTLRLTVGRGYDQPFDVTILNNDSLPYHVQANVLNLPENLIVGFTGPGSPDEEYYSYGPESFYLDLRVHTQDVIPGNYRFDLELTSWRDDSATVYLPVELTVTAPSLSIDAQVIAVDSLTLGHTIRIINYGDTITNLTVALPDSLRDKVYILPQIEHFLLGTGDSIFCEVMPFLTMMEMNARGIDYNDRGFVQQFSSNFLNNQSGDLEIHYDGELSRLPLDFTPPENKQVWLGNTENVRYCIEMRAWYCTNKPTIVVALNMPSGIDPAIITDGMLSVSFEPRSSIVPDHDMALHFNENQVGELLNGVPHGTYSFLVDHEDINFAGEGNASNLVRIETKWQTGGHYVVTEKFFFCLCLDRYSQYVVAENQEQADSIVNALPQLRHGLENLTIVDNKPLLGDSVALGSQITIQATSFENDSVHAEIAVMAEFSNGEELINLYDDGWHSDLLPFDGVYGNLWQPNNVGTVDITIRAGICGTYESVIIPSIEIVYPRIKAVAPVNGGPPQALEGARVELFRDEQWLKIDGVTDSNGEIELITMEEGSLPADIAEGEFIRITFEVDTTQSYKWPGVIRGTTPVRRITIDSDEITDQGDRTHVARTGELTQTVSLEHTLIRFSLVVATQWDIGENNDAVIAKYIEGLKKTCNYLYDITDGQVLLDTIYFTDSRRFHEDSCDVKIYAAHTTDGGGPRVVGAVEHFIGKLDSLPFNNYKLINVNDTAHSSIWMPRTWLNNIDDTRKILVSKLPDWSEESKYFIWSGKPKWAKPFIGFTHELGHYLFGFHEEYKCFDGVATSDCTTPSALNAFGLMMMGQPLASEMSSDSVYLANPQYQTTLQYLMPGNRSCWGQFEDTYEGTVRYDSLLGDAKLFINSPSDRGFRLSGPNSLDWGLNAPLNVGSEMHFNTQLLTIDRGVSPSSVLLHVKECSWMGFGYNDADGASVKVKYASESEYFSQGDADDDGWILLLGVHLDDEIQITNRGTPPISQTLGSLPIEGNARVFTIPCNLDEIEGDVIAEQGTGSSFEIIISNLIGTIGSQANWYSICAGLSDMLDVITEPLQYRIIVPLDYILCGTIIINGTDTSGNSCEYFIDYSRHQYDTASSRIYSYIRDGKSRIDLDSSYGSSGKVDLIASGFRYGNWPSGMEPISRLLWVGFSGMSTPMSGNNMLRIEFNNLPDYSGYYDRFVICKLDTITQNWQQVITAVDTIGLFTETIISEQGHYQLFIPSLCCQGIRGNVNGDPLNQIDISDLVGLVAYMFQGGEEPPCLEEGDIDGSGGIDISDLVGLIAYMFQSGEPPAGCP